MPFQKTLTIHFFITRQLKQLNKKMGLNIHASDIRLLFYLQVMGPLNIRGFAKLNYWKSINGSSIPKLRDAGFLELKNKKYSCTFEGDQFLRRYADMLGKARLDRITLAEKKKRPSKRQTKISKLNL